MTEKRGREREREGGGRRKRGRQLETVCLRICVSVCLTLFRTMFNFVCSYMFKFNTQRAGMEGFQNDRQTFEYALYTTYITCLLVSLPGNFTSQQPQQVKRIPRWDLLINCCVLPHRRKSQIRLVILSGYSTLTPSQHHGPVSWRPTTVK